MSARPRLPENAPPASRAKDACAFTANVCSAQGGLIEESREARASPQPARCAAFKADCNLRAPNRECAACASHLEAAALVRAAKAPRAATRSSQFPRLCSEESPPNNAHDALATPSSNRRSQSAARNPGSLSGRAAKQSRTPSPDLSGNRASHLSEEPFNSTGRLANWSREK